MLEAQRIKRIKFSPIALTLVMLLCALAAVGYVLSNGFGYREIIVSVILLATLSVIFAGERGLILGFLALMISFGIGYRTLTLSQSLKIHPSEIIICGLLVLLILQRVFLRNERVSFWMPVWVLSLVPFWFWGLVIGAQAGRAWDKMFAEMRAFLILVPMFIVAGAMLTQRVNWRHILLAFYVAGFWIAGMGVLEYIFPGVKSIFPGFMSDGVPMITPDDFARAQFTFWGTPAATFVLVLTAPMCVAAWHIWRARWMRILILIALAVQVFAIYIGGFRSMWLLTMIECAVFALMQRGFERKAATILLGIVMLTALSVFVLPRQASERVNSLIAVLEGNPTDSSGEKRWQRADDAINDIAEAPLGRGWAGLKFVHSDFLQTAANLGVFAGLIFFIAYLFTLLRFFQRVRRAYFVSEEQHAIGIALLLAFIAVGGIFTVQPVLNVIQIAIPVWFVWVMVEFWMRYTPTENLYLPRDSRSAFAGGNVSENMTRNVKRNMARNVTGKRFR